MADDETVADRIRVILKETGKSHRALSALVGSHGFVGTILKGSSKKPAGERLATIANKTGYAVAWLVDGVGPKYAVDAVPSEAHHAIARVSAHVPGATLEAQLRASARVFGLIGTDDMSDEIAVKLLKDAIANLEREGALAEALLPPKVAPTVVTDDDLGGGLGDVPKSKTRKR